MRGAEGMEALLSSTAVRWSPRPPAAAPALLPSNPTPDLVTLLPPAHRRRRQRARSRPASLLALSSSHANAGPAQRQHRLAITSTPQHSYSSSASSSSLPPTSSSSSLLRMVQMSASSPGKKCGESQDGRVGCMTFRAGGKRGTTDD
ncbi:uncharacterized protein LOC130197856 isoform X5 [Pseudoliparis swirei]|uniref:uncharacterized protein LOC130197856 isoform X5 n=1 Tax=Pseudoliparis swirei TaxID=2059687 RepID=UPI0024BDA289|nr:uncharacterized protein LOC130197856 isoform X5 [Pseudoliparis swirei]